MSLGLQPLGRPLIRAIAPPISVKLCAMCVKAAVCVGAAGFSSRRGSVAYGHRPYGVDVFKAGDTPLIVGNGLDLSLCASWLVRVYLCNHCIIVCPTLQLHSVTQTNKELPQMPCPPSPSLFNHYPACMAFQPKGMTRRLLLCSLCCILVLFSYTHAHKHTLFLEQRPVVVSISEAK